MSHVADGDLHAYLDGALEFYPPRQATRIREHLEGCPECRRRLDVEARVADDARTVLEDATPLEQLAPPLEELRRRAELGPAVVKSATRAGWRVHWAWAAMVVLALGVGWGVGAWPGGSGSPGGIRAEAESLAAPPAATEPEARVSEGIQAPPSEATAVAASSAPQKAEAAQPPRVAAAPAPLDPLPSANAAAAADVSSEERAAALTDPVLVLQRRSPEIQPPTLGADAASRLSDLAGASVAASAPQQPVATTGSASTADASAARRRAEQDAPLERPMVSRQRVTPGAPGFVDPRVRVGGLARSLDRPARASEEPSVSAPLTLPGLDIEVVELGDVGPDTAVRVVQSRSDGTPVELIFVGVTSPAERQARAAGEAVAASPGPGAGASSGVGGASAAAPPPATPRASPPEHVARYQVRVGWEHVTVPFRGGWLIVQAPMSRAAIRGLLQSAGVPIP